MHDAVSTAVRDRATHAGVAELGTLLGVWAHPDDEAYLSGGLMALARDAGSRVVCVAAERTGELARCLKVLGVMEHHWSSRPPCGLGVDHRGLRPRGAVRGAAAVCRGRRMAGAAVERARRQPGHGPPRLPGPPPGGRFAVDLVLDPDTAARKVRALTAQATQTAGLIAAMGVECYTAWVGDKSFAAAPASGRS
ncbi:hypothetical protein PA7_44040 [Pseudonocardia asaccharolytica DSM 44247 = NBRC 16224]|uniref:GlcNAc-PI de-N-acetylase n=1 Tax=Pseudonocardia asaccharolytica DSM 44247 = NBRC 16224 TaxID=1123024 RepID=A0A511D7H7_9PSEU|nr:hypothetical protein PA7_44040 [Pseudonocardia asaccharolytica DSM 44247 = NBRC 16224]